MSADTAAADEPVRIDAPPADPGAVRSVYVHAPFCARRCFYCDFAVTVRRGGDAGAWTGAVGSELDALAREGRFRLAGALDTLYVGGGTPSLLGADAMAALARTLGPERLREPGLEWTAEANPESFTPPLARAWRRAGANRVSLGVQSFSPGVLRWMGRLHGPDGALRAVRTAREAGFDRVSVDLIFGLPDHLGRSWRDDLERAVDLDVSHLSLYGLTVEDGTPLGRAVAEGREEVADEGRYREEYLEAAERLAGAGYRHYEVSNFARPGAASRHNRAYWGEAPYLGLGNSAHSYLHPLRRWNIREWAAYEERTREGALPVAGEETLDAVALRLERVWLALRTDRGLATAPLGRDAAGRVERWVSRGLARRTDDAVVLTPAGWLVMDRLAVELDAALDDA